VRQRNNVDAKVAGQELHLVRTRVEYPRRILRTLDRATQSSVLSGAPTTRRAKFWPARFASC
jgi:hypothetical protein